MRTITKSILLVLTVLTIILIISIVNRFDNPIVITAWSLVYTSTSAIIAIMVIEVLEKN